MAFLYGGLFSFVIFGGGKRIARTAELIVPFMAIGYVLLSIVILFVNASRIPYVFGLILSSAFNMNAVYGAVFGQAVSWGVKRGIFSNEARGFITENIPDVLYGNFTQTAVNTVVPGFGGGFVAVGFRVGRGTVYIGPLASSNPTVPPCPDPPAGTSSSSPDPPTSPGASSRPWPAPPWTIVGPTSPS